MYLLVPQITDINTKIGEKSHLPLYYINRNALLSLNIPQAAKFHQIPGVFFREQTTNCHF